MTSPSSYTVADYGAMIVDPVRMDRYARALEQAVRPDAVVVDIGTGTGIFALLACRFGARRVYAIEPDDVIQVAREIAGANAIFQTGPFERRLRDIRTVMQQAQGRKAHLQDVGAYLLGLEPALMFA